MTCNSKCIHYPVCEQQNYDFANIEECPYYQDNTNCMEEDAKQASIPYTYNAPQHDWKCGYPDNTRGKDD